MASHVSRPLVRSGRECDAYVGDGFFSRSCLKPRNTLVLT